MTYLLAHDVGTSGNKAVVVDADGNLIGSAYDDYPTDFPHPTWAEQSPDRLWQAVEQTTQRVLETTGIAPKDLAAVSFSTQMVNAILLDGQGAPLRPAVNWLDGRATAEAEWVMRRLGGRRVFSALFGVALTGKDLLPKYIWLKRNEPDLFRRTAAIVDVSGYLLARATGRLVYEWTAASVTGFFHLKTKKWRPNLMRYFGLSANQFPELVHSCEVVGGLQPAAASQLGLLAGTPVVAGAGDAMSVAVGSGAVDNGDGHLCLGTSGFVGIITDRQVSGRHGLVTLQSADRDKLLLIGETETCGECLKWAAQHLYGQPATAMDFSVLDHDVASTAPGAGQLLFTPWLYGERSPVPDELVRASFVNLSASHSRAQMTRAIYEGVGLNLRWILETISKQYGFPAEPLRVVGGGAEAPVWLQIIADTTGRTLETVPNPQEAGAVGAAMLAAVGIGLFPSVSEAKRRIHVGQRLTPNSETHSTYEQLFPAFQSIYRSLRTIHQRLNRNTSASTH